MDDVWILWEWPYDRHFVEAILEDADAVGVTALAIGPSAMGDALARLRAALDAPKVVVDRASDALDSARDIAALARLRGAVVMNDPERVGAAVDKARMHLALMSIGVDVPWTLVAPALSQDPTWQWDHDARIGRPFVIKPSHGSGGDGVVVDATCEQDVAMARDARPTEAHLLQEFVPAADLAGRPAYFRAIYCLGQVDACFWDPRTRRYALPGPEDEGSPWIERLSALSRSIARVAAMALFSTEVAMTADGRLVAVDYVNDMCDLRLASRHPDGIPDSVVRRVSRRIAEVTARLVRPGP